MAYVKNVEVFDKLNNNFSYHTPIGDQADRYGRIRDKAKELAEMLEILCPTSRELSLAMTNLEQAVMWANASIARNETEETINAGL
jgi:glycyl-tRNA synthetase beta subunit